MKNAHIGNVLSGQVMPQLKRIEAARFTESDLREAARMGAEEGYDTPKQGYVSFTAIAEQVVTAFLSERATKKEDGE